MVERASALLSRRIIDLGASVGDRLRMTGVGHLLRVVDVMFDSLEVQRIRPSKGWRRHVRRAKAVNRASGANLRQGGRVNAASD